VRPGCFKKIETTEASSREIPVQHGESRFNAVLAAALRRDPGALQLSVCQQNNLLRFHLHKITVCGMHRHKHSSKPLFCCVCLIFNNGWIPIIDI